ncbi:MAG: UDP-N-acetylmuramoyl-L-alanine--D-glutamate ligase [Rickettsiales bacterium]|nr:UDP-N-acetylmuramoyl-L-alanine--D-glutamate ligase [Rickettsiales bacterium]
MITVSAYNQKAVGVFGLGKAGEATIAALVAGGAKIYAWDDNDASRAAAEKSYGSRIQLLPYESWPWAELQALVLSPGVPLTHPAPHGVVALAHRHQRPVIGDIELLYQAQPEARYIVITGTNGKSTTTTLIGHILKTAGMSVQVGGNLGTAALALEPLGKDGVYVIEASSYQLDLLASTHFDVAVFLNITPDHLDRHGSMEGYIAAKMHIFDRQTKDDVAVIAVDDDYTRRIAAELSQAHLVPVSAHQPVKQGVYVEEGVLIDGKKRYDISQIATLTGRHNWQNAAVAYSAARAVGIEPEVIYRAMQSFGGLRHRLQGVATIRGVRFINDSKATNADATRNALDPFESIYWILGGKSKAGGIESLTSYLPKIAHAFLIGAASDEFAQTLEGKVPYTRCGTLAVAVDKAAAMAWKDGKKDAVVLLSPACASFDQWKSFEQRGDAFCDMVAALEGKAKHAS